jgi:hypothetical protein
MVEGDVPFVRDSWLRSAWHRESRKLQRQRVGQRERMRISKRFFEDIRPHVTMLIRDGAISVVIACDREDPNHIAGWIALRDGREVRLYVKQAYRPWGIDALLRAATEVV